MLYHQSVHNNLKTRRERKHISNLIQFFHFSFFWSGHTIPIILYSTNIFFCKRKQLFFIFNTVFFLTPFILDMSVFSSFNTQKHIFNFSRKWIRHLFFDLSSFHSFFFIQSKTLSYYEKGTEWKTPFCTFPRIQNTIFCFDKSQFFWVLMTL